MASVAQHKTYERVEYKDHLMNIYNHLLEQITLEIGASRIHNQVADQRSKNDSNESMKQTLQDEICIKPTENNRQIRLW
jgi:hypothetical protein